jgi:hypothetical protein
MASSERPDYRLYMVTREPFDPRKMPEPAEQKDAAWYIVQLTGPLTFEERNRLRETYKLKLSDYVPNFAYLELLEPATWRSLSNDDLYRASLLYESSDKISPNISDFACGEDDPDRHLRVVLFTDVKVDEFLRDLSSLLDKDEVCARFNLSPEQVSVLNDKPLGGSTQLILPPVPGEVVLAISRLPYVRWVEEKRDVDSNPLSPNSGLITNSLVLMVMRVVQHLVGRVNREPTPGGLVQSGTPSVTPVWDKGIQGQEQTIGITDFAINPDHCMFSDINPIGQNHRKIAGSRQRPFDKEQPHGHVVAALAAGHAPQDVLLKDSKGMAWQARLSLDDRREMRAGRVSFLQALTNQTGDFAFIHSNSWHDASGYGQTAADADTFVWEHEEHLVCGSTGNSEEHQIGPPGSAKNALCVSASGNFGGHMNVGDGSAGPVGGGDLRHKPDICAPGCNMTTAGKKNCNGANITNCATSWATPITAGTAALVRQYYLEGWFPTGTKRAEDKIEHPSAALVKATLLNSTVDMQGVNGYPSDLEGWGRVLLTNTLFFAEEGTPKLFVRDIPNATGLHTHESHTYNVAVTDGRPLKITLVWSDSPALALASRPLVNDLNLIVTSPDGKTFLGNHIGEDGISVEGGSPDNINNVEMVIRNQNLQGVWTITVFCEAAHGSTGTQGYALVLTAALV